eukprot:7578936-Alexandrium_andersonii.AAC.1
MRQRLPDYFRGAMFDSRGRDSDLPAWVLDPSHLPARGVSFTPVQVREATKLLSRARACAED